ncbi:LOW QUALITY PROTEIN: nucleophosmin-like [Glossophaga mutica]
MAPDQPARSSYPAGSNKTRGDRFDDDDDDEEDNCLSARYLDNVEPGQVQGAEEDEPLKRQKSCRHVVPHREGAWGCLTHKTRRNEWSYDDDDDDDDDDDNDHDLVLGPHRFSPGTLLAYQAAFLHCRELKADQDYLFKVDSDENQHPWSLQMAGLGAVTQDELHRVEAEAMNYEGSPTEVTLATLKMSVQPTVAIGGFEITPPVVLQSRCGSGPVHSSGQHLVAVQEDAGSGEEEEVKLLSMSGKPHASGRGSKVPEKKVKLAADEDNNDEEDEEEDEDEDDDFEDEETETPVKKRDTPAKYAQKSNQNGKTINTKNEKVKCPSNNRKELLKH